VRERANRQSRSRRAADDGSRLARHARMQPELLHTTPGVEWVVVSRQRSVVRRRWAVGRGAPAWGVSAMTVRRAKAKYGGAFDSSSEFKWAGPISNQACTPVLGWLFGWLRRRAAGDHDGGSLSRASSCSRVGAGHAAVAIHSEPDYSAAAKAQSAKRPRAELRSFVFFCVALKRAPARAVWAVQ